jgi:hypothetical protein
MERLTPRAVNAIASAANEIAENVTLQELQEISRLALPSPAMHYACHPLVVTRPLHMVDHGNSDNCTRRFQLDSQLILHCFQHGWTR